MHTRLIRCSVPAMVSDLMDSSLAGYSLEGLFFGGCAAPDVLAARAKQVFPKAQLYVAPQVRRICKTYCSSRSQGYGLTETNSISVTVGGYYLLAPALTSSSAERR